MRYSVNIWNKRNQIIINKSNTTPPFIHWISSIRTSVRAFSYSKIEFLHTHVLILVQKYKKCHLHSNSDIFFGLNSTFFISFPSVSVFFFSSSFFPYSLLSAFFYLLRILRLHMYQSQRKTKQRLHCHCECEHCVCVGHITTPISPVRPSDRTNITNEIQRHDKNAWCDITASAAAGAHVHRVKKYIFIYFYIILNTNLLPIDFSF